MTKAITYVGTKLINAIPMTRQQYNELRGWTLPADEAGTAPGYLVEYLDGGEANHPNFRGYISWSPQEVFERAYRALGLISDLPAWQQRVIAEQVQLTDKVIALDGYLLGSEARKLDPDQYQLLVEQFNAMCQYLTLLNRRITFFYDAK